MTSPVLKNLDPRVAQFFASNPNALTPPDQPIAAPGQIAQAAQPTAQSVPNATPQSAAPEVANTPAATAAPVPTASPYGQYGQQPSDSTSQPLSARDQFFQQNPGAVNGFMPQRPVNELENVHGIRKALALAFGGMDSFGSFMSGQRPTVLPRWTAEGNAQAQYDANQPVIRAGAMNQAWQQHLGEERTQAETGLEQAQAGLANVQAQNYSGPAQEQALKAFDDLKQEWASGKYDPQTFDQVAQARLAILPPNVQRMVQAQMGAIKNLPVQPPSFQMKDGSIQPINWRGQQYGLAPTAGEPPEITQARNTAVTSLQKGELAKLDPIIRMKLGDPPVDDGTPQSKQAIQAYGNAAEKIKTEMSTANTRLSFSLQNALPQGTGGQPSAMAQAVANGQMQWKDVISPRTPISVKSAFLSEVKQLNPNFNSGDFSIEQEVKKDFTSGPAAGQLQAYNTALAHLPIFVDKAQALDNGDTQALNALGQAINTQFGSDKATNFNIAKQAFMGEVGKAMAGANVGEGDRRALENSVNQANSFTQLQGAARTAQQLLEGKRSVMKQQYEQGTQAKPNFGAPTQGGGSQPPAGATHKAPGSDGKLHYTNAQGQDLGVAQ